MKITVYTITDCQFSKQEKEYLQQHNLQYEEKNLETNKDFLTEMLAVSNNFAGTPVTRVEKDDGSIAVLKGFTKEEFDAALGFTSASTTTTEPIKTEEQPVKPVETPIESEQTSAPTEPAAQTTATESPQPANITASAPPMDEKLGSVLDKLEEKTDPLTTPTETSTEPTIPPVSDAPTIPDFSADTSTQPTKQ